MKSLSIVLVGALLLATGVGAQQIHPLKEYRYCGEPVRTASGEIRRRSDVRMAFRALYKCPSTGEATGKCPGWSIDHVIPLAVGGCDVLTNLQWLPNAIKSSAGELPKDRWEREVYKTAE